MTTATTKPVTELTTSELLLANTSISNELDTTGLPQSWTHDHKARAILSRRREIRAELNRRHEANA